jgi:hypothetical protein
VKPSWLRAPVFEVLRIDSPYSPDPSEKASVLCLQFHRRFFFAPLHGTFDRTGIYGHTKATSDGFDNALFAIGHLPPLLHEIQDLVRALMGAPRAALARHQSRKTMGLKMDIRHIESLPADPERMRNIRDCLALNAVSAEHLISHLYKVPAIEEIIGLKSFVLNILRMAMEGTLLSKRLEFGIERFGCHVNCIYYTNWHRVKNYFAYSLFPYAYKNNNTVIYKDNASMDSRIMDVIIVT